MVEINRDEIDRQTDALREKVTYIGNRMSRRFRGVPASVPMKDNFSLQFDGHDLYAHKPTDDPDSLSRDHFCKLKSEPASRLMEAVGLLPDLIAALEKKCQLEIKNLAAVNVEAEKVLDSLPIGET